MYLQPGLCAWDDRWTLKPDLITVSICHCNITHMTNKNRPISSWQSYDKIKNLLVGWHVKASIKDVLQTSVGMNAPEGHCSNPSLSLCSNVRVGSGGGAAAGRVAHWPCAPLWKSVLAVTVSVCRNVLMCGRKGRVRLDDGGCGVQLHLSSSGSPSCMFISPLPANLYFSCLGYNM